MKKLFLIGATALMVSNSTFAGGILTNTNQNATFLRNPARNAAIAIDGVYSNPAGIAFLPEGFHLSVSWQAAFQKRLMDVNNSTLGMDKEFKGETNAPVIPSFQAAYVINDKWSVSAQFAVGGGGGACEFNEGLPMFQELIGGKLVGAQASSYSMAQNLTGEQYFYGFQIGGTYKLAENLSFFGGLRGVLANCSYVGRIGDIKAAGQLSGGQTVSASDYLTKVAQYMNSKGQAEVAATATAGAQLMAQDLVLDCAQSGFGITPIIGLDWNLGKLNLAAKYEFRTKIELENESNNSANLAALATQFPTVAVYADGAKVRSDIPALLTLGAQYEITDNVRAMVGGVYYWDKDAKAGLSEQNKYAINYGDNTWEANFGVEWDMNEKVMLSFGGQRTQFGFDDADMSDTSFFTGCSSLAIGGAYKFSEKIKLNIGYMHSFYDTHNFNREVVISESAKPITACSYTRKNDAVGVSLDIRF